MRRSRAGGESNIIMARLPYNPKLTKLARSLRKNMTPFEKIMWYEFLSTHIHRFMRQRPIDNYIVDFYCASKKLVIEIDGDSHGSNDSRNYDIKRTRVLEYFGLKVIRFTNKEITESFESVCEEINKALDN